MELIGRVAHREGAGARACGPAVRRGHHDVVRNLQAAGGRVEQRAAHAPGRDAQGCRHHIAADRGLCGGYNTTVIRAAEHDMRDQERAGRETRS